MKKLLAATLLASTLAAPAFADESPWYLGGSIGSSDIGSSSSTAVGVLLGYKLQGVNLGGTGSLAIEGQLTGLGSTSYSDRFTSLGVDAVASFPIRPVPNLSLYGKAGLNNISGDFHCGTFCSYSKSSGLQFDYGLGGEYRFTREFGLRVGYQSYDSDIDSVYATAVFHF
jgi:opacity protein-like surface antigen